MVAFWPTIRARPSAVPAAARPFPHADGATPPPTARGGGLATWPRPLDWPAARDAPSSSQAPAAGATPTAAVDVPLTGPVEVWRAAREGGRLGEGPHMPSYDECFQCLC